MALKLVGMTSGGWFSLRARVLLVGMAFPFLVRGQAEAADDPPPWIARQIIGRAGPGSYNLTLADLNGDGKLDLAYSNGTASYWRKNDGAGGFVGGGELGSFVGSNSMIFADIDADGDMDRLGSRDQNAWFENDGQGSFAEHPGFGAGLEWAGDVDGDGPPDLVFVGASEVTWRRNMGGAIFAPPERLFGAIVGTGFLTRLMAAELNGDGLTDFLANIPGGAVGVFLREDDGLVRNKGTVPGLRGLYSVEIGDVDGDGDGDVVADNGQYQSDGQSSVPVNSKFLNNGQGDFAAEQLVSSSERASGHRLVELDGDGRLDLADFSGWARQRSDGSFEWRTYLEGFSGGFYLPAGDIDGDGDIDLVTNVGPYGEVWVLENPLLSSSQATIVTWRQQHFGSPENTGLGADDQDPDGDSVINLLEYAFGLNPHDGVGNHGAAGLPMVRAEPGLPRAFQFALPVPAARDLTFTVEFNGGSLLLGTTTTWAPVGFRKRNGSWTRAFAPLQFFQWNFVTPGPIVDGRQQFALSGAVVEGDALWRIRVEREP